MAVTFLAIAAALVVVALACGLLARNTEGAHPTDQPGALAGNLAGLFVGGIVALVAVLVVIGLLR